MKTGWVKVQDFEGDYATIRLDFLGDLLELNEVGNLKDFIESMSDAKVIAYGVSEVTYLDASGLFADETDKGSFDTVEQRAVFHFRDADGGKFTFSIPAPKDEIFEANQQPKKAYAKSVRDKIAELTSREASDLHYLGGGLRSKVPPINERSKAI